MKWAPRIKPGQVLQLYKTNSSGLYDEDLLLEIGWGLFARCEATVKVGRAYQGEVPCPVCEEIVLRKKNQKSQPAPSRTWAPAAFDCPYCKRSLTWQGCRESLRSQPRCFDCTDELKWQYGQDQLTCASCDKQWAWNKYRQSIKNRVKLPCSFCFCIIHKPATTRQMQIHGTREDASAAIAEPLICPRCKGEGKHVEGKFICEHCGHEKSWREYRRRLKRLVERLECASCGHSFTWDSWRRQPEVQSMLNGNGPAIEQFMKQWLASRSSEKRMIAIDNLIHALHGRGVMAPVFIEGTQESIAQLLDKVAFE